jgi:ribosomal-protein-alanine N-acetyltransferase
MINNGTVQLETDRLILRKFVMGDVEQSYLNWASDYEASKYFAFYPHKEKSDTENIIKQWINAYQGEEINYIWAIVKKAAMK